MLKFLPIRDIVPLPEDLFSALEDGESNPLDNIGVEDFRIAGRVIELDMLCISETILGLPAIDCLGIVIGGNNVTRFGIVVNFSDPFEIAVTTLISLRFSSSLLNPVKLSEAGLKRVRETFSWEDKIKQYLKLYKNSMARRIE